MGSGETAPTMARVHRLLLARLGLPPAPAVLLDTPYGFQENADEITARALEYFRENVGMRMAVAPFRAADEEPLLRATALARMREARYLFAGPGSPSYALRQWRGSEVPEVIFDKLARGGVVAFASAAALTLGARTIPVYEIYKVGAPPTWLDGLDVLGRLGLDVAVVPHYDNAEGGSHDTRFCYMGERRLVQLEAELSAGQSILGVDSHTCLVFDFGAGTAAVLGLGGVTVRVAGRSEVLPTGTTLTVDELRAIAARLDRSAAVEHQATPAAETATYAAAPTPGVPPSTRSPLLDEVHGQEQRFEAAVTAQDRAEAVRAVLAVENLLLAWSRDTAGGDELDRARGVLQALIVRLTDLGGTPDSSLWDRLAPLIELLIEARARARAARDFGLADAIRDGLVAAGVELHDAPAGTSWELLERGAPA
jgi:cyanophycinase-like exopeptidase